MVFYVPADISPLLAKSDDPRMGEDPGVAEVVRQLDQACRVAGFFYVVTLLHPFINTSLCCKRLMAQMVL